MNGNLAVATQKCGGWANCVISHTMWPAMTAFSIDSQTLMLHFGSQHSQISRPLFGDKASQPFGCVSVRWEILKSTLPRSATQVLPIFVNATKRVLGYRRPSQCSLTAAALTIVASHHCANQNQHDSDLFVDFLRKWSGTQVSRMRNMTRKQTESKQSGHRCISHRVPWCTELKRSNITVGLASA